jgi:cytochrome c oxidase subunit 1
MHGTTMVFFVGMPILFGFGNYLVPLMIGARDMAFPRLNAFSFWISAFGGLLLYFSYVGWQRPLRRRAAPDVGWFAYAPLTARVFSPGHSTDYWTSPCCSAASAASAPRSTSSPPRSACAAPA